MSVVAPVWPLRFIKNEVELKDESIRFLELLNVKRFIRLSSPFFLQLVAASLLAPALAIASEASAEKPPAQPAPVTSTQPMTSEGDAPHTADTSVTNPEDVKSCRAQIEKTVRPQNRARLEKQCELMRTLAGCASEQGRSIQHIDFDSQNKKGVESKRILVFGLIHGDEPLAGEMTLEWALRLFTLRDRKIEARNDWRVIPMLNPDGLFAKTRTNSHGIDLNRNFPSRDWADEAPAYFKSVGQKERRYPGEKAASESETRCAIAQIKDFKPDFIVSVHTPYHVLDFDGPRINFPKYKDLPWRALGTFPGSLGRFMWRDNSVPVLTVELGLNMIDVASLQDIVGTFAIEAARKSGTKTALVYENLSSETAKESTRETARATTGDRPEKKN
jgi:protein MpaA